MSRKITGPSTHRDHIEFTALKFRSLSGNRRSDRCARLTGGPMGGDCSQSCWPDVDRVGEGRRRRCFDRNIQVSLMVEGRSLAAWLPAPPTGPSHQESTECQFEAH